MWSKNEAILIYASNFKSRPTAQIYTIFGPLCIRCIYLRLEENVLISLTFVKNNFIDFSHHYAGTPLIDVTYYCISRTLHVLIILLIVVFAMYFSSCNYSI